MNKNFYTLLTRLAVVITCASVSLLFGQEPDYVIITEADAFIS